MDSLRKTVLITGGARGIGRQIAIAFQREGYNVCITYNKSETDAMELKQRGFDTYKVDVTNEAEARACIDSVISKYGRIDCLVNNAGIAEIRLFTSITEANFKRMLDTNLTGAFTMSRLVIAKTMLQNKSGNIINISSIWGKSGGSCEVHYSASKAGLIGMTKALAKEMGPSNIRVNAVAPGVVKTDMLKTLTEDDLKELEQQIPLGRLGTPEDVATVVLFLASDAARYVTGDVITVDGGMYM